MALPATYIATFVRALVTGIVPLVVNTGWWPTIETVGRVVRITVACLAPAWFPVVG